ncbi:Capsule polysaccharide biosynthesis protein [Agrobacterium sp. DSM 25558]|uniref:capsule biosynthesis protein n=1 Tax=Agrobacterium sp. DSM 25558 TaxID=1907665 RepID=UPI000972612C|nr:capsular biosynthesis protein [Agrobacterium sp. DSM 25558]SCX27205.1 Capsule polysaccharide biosynthesis protein [Agrobacterium sp. DSM 25558]
MNPVAAAEAHRVFLFLQGPSSSLFYKIADQLEDAGHTCLRVNLNVGDWLFWRRRGGLNYRGRFSDWPAYIEKLLASRYVTDLVLLGEERPYHRIAVDLAKSKDIAVTVIEMGYLRPDWITVERDGMSSNSRFPNDPERIRVAAASLVMPSMEPMYKQSFLMEALLDLSYNLPNVFLGLLFPHYRRHALFHPLAEYAGWIIRLSKANRCRKKADAAIGAIQRSGQPFFVYPLQLETDYQLRAHSPYHRQAEAIEEVLNSFARHSSPEVELVIKLHPLDNGLIDWRDKIEILAGSMGVKERVHFIDGGDLNMLSHQCSGMVTVNSTAVLNGLRLGVPVKVLGCAIYDLPGMTHQSDLQNFWSTPQKPDSALTASFIKLLAHAVHVRGNFYSRAGTNAAAKDIAQKLVANDINMPDADCGFPPRTRPKKRSCINETTA